ncbi:metallophosphoesterase [Nostoc carneum NIES-2107]|nr:metallophosphoesterase [Nostoc carneum NIES-2107]
MESRSQLFIGRSGQGFNKHRPYSCLRIDVKGDGQPKFIVDVKGDGQPKFIVRPLVAEWYQRQWCDREIEPFEI